MSERTKRFLAVGLVVVLVMVVAGIFAAARPATPLPSPTSTPTSPPPATMDVAAANPLPTASATPIEIQTTPISSPTPILPSLSTTSFLTSRRPTFAELDAYLVGREINFTTYGSEDTIVLTRLSPHLQVIYEDLNGDDEVDMMIWQHIPTDNQGTLLVMLWEMDHYLHPLAVYNWGEYGGPGHHIVLEDWTGDQMPEIVLDISQVNGGAGLHIITWLRYIIRCQVHCEVIWSGILDELSVINSSRTIQWASFERASTESGKPMFTITRSGFSSPHLHDHYLKEQATVLPETKETWIWDGHRFVLSNEQVVAERYETNFQPVLSATNSSGDTAMLFVEPDEERQSSGFIIDNCTLMLNEIVLSETFWCVGKLAWVSWQDITQDGQVDLILIATDPFSGQRLLAYEWDGVKARNIADITGEIVDSNLYGVRIENRDEDDAWEIIAGHVEIKQTCVSMVIYSGEVVDDCWYESLNLYDVVYNWNDTLHSYLNSGRVP